MGRLLSGDSKSFDVDDLEKNFVSNGFDACPEHLNEFWKVLRTFTD